MKTDFPLPKEHVAPSLILIIEPGRSAISCVMFAVLPLFKLRVILLLIGKVYSLEFIEPTPLIERVSDFIDKLPLSMVQTRRSLASS